MRNLLLNKIAQHFNLADEEDFGNFQEWEAKDSVSMYGTPIKYAIKRGWEVEFYSFDGEIIFSGELDDECAINDLEVA